jgi:hypothetical protein
MDRIGRRRLGNRKQRGPHRERPGRGLCAGGGDFQPGSGWRFTGQGRGLSRPGGLVEAAPGREAELTQGGGDPVVLGPG